MYVTNRFQQIRDHSDPDTWLYVPTDKNPADHASRGISAGQLNDSNWFTGPTFLWQEPMVVPEKPVPKVTASDPEVKCHSLRVQQAHPSLANLLERFSEWKKAVSVTELLFTCILARKNKEISKTAIHKKAINQILKSMQEDCFDEVISLRNNKEVSRNSQLFRMNLFLDNEGIMIVGGRLSNNNTLSFEKHPAILPNDNHVTKVLIRHLHQSVAHQGKNMTLSKLRSAGYWIINAHSVVSSVIFHCVICKELRPRPIIPQMSALPETRVTPQPLFTAVGVDWFGPFIVKERRSELKRYGLMITCLESRAVHIEVLDDMSTTSFIHGVRNVIAIRGPIRVIYCDRGTNFMRAISEIFKKGSLEFKVNPPSASHMGGVWERMIRTARNVLVY